MTDRMLGGQVCDQIVCGASRAVDQVAIQLLIIDRSIFPVGSASHPYAFCVMSTEEAEKFYNDFGRALAQVKNQVQ